MKRNNPARQDSTLTKKQLSEAMRQAAKLSWKGGRPEWVAWSKKRKRNEKGQFEKLSPVDSAIK